MKKVSGVLHLTKKEIEALKTIIHHTRVDISFNGGGTYNLGDADNTHDEKTAKKAELGIDVINFIIDTI